MVKAFSWLAVVVETLADQPVVVDIASKIEHLDTLYQQGKQPFEKFDFPSEARTTLNSLILYSRWSNSALWSRYLRITTEGNIEYAETKNAFVEGYGQRYFRFVQIAGMVWQLLFFSKSLLGESGYKSTVRLTVNLVGTRETILADFSQEPGEGQRYWRDPLKERHFFDAHELSKTSCHDRNLKMVYDLNIGNLNEGESHSIVKALGNKLGLAYNHQSTPRCFNCDTDIFPWKQYQSDRRY